MGTPIIELAKFNGFYITESCKVLDEYSYGWESYEASDIFTFDTDSKSFKKRVWNQYKGSENIFLPKNYESVKRILKWGFDLHGLIEQGIAIDINKI